MLRPPILWAALLAPAVLGAAADDSQDFAKSVRPVLAQNCGGCHNNPANPRGPVNFLKATKAKDVDRDRGVWRNVAAQLRNRTMPPVDSKLTEDDRLRVAQWVDRELRASACSIGDYAGSGTGAPPQPA